MYPFTPWLLPIFRLQTYHNLKSANLPSFDSNSLRESIKVEFEKANNLLNELLAESIDELGLE